MNKSFSTQLVVFAMVLALVGCSRRPQPQVVAEPEPPPPPVQTVQAPPAQPVEEQLEDQRALVERLLNQIMSQDVYFEFDQHTLTSAGRDVLSAVGQILVRETRIRLVVEGHTDERGTESYNMGLGGRRAESVRSYLLNYGVDSGRMQAISFGEERPKAQGSSEGDWAQNRRAAFRATVQ